MLLNVIYFLIILLVVCILIYAVLQALTYMGVNIPTPIRNIVAAILFLLLLYILLKYANLLPPGLGMQHRLWIEFLPT